MKTGKRLLLLPACAAAVLLFAGSRALAQDDQLRYSFEGRMGFTHLPSTTFLASPEGNHFSGGVLGSYRPSITEGSVWNRFTGRISFDRTGLGGEDVDVGLKVTERLWLTNFAVGFDAVQLPRFNLILHGGVAIARDSFVIQGQTTSGQFVDACSSFPGFCDSDWSLLGNEGVDARFVPMESWSFFFVGMDYTHFAGSKNQFMFLGGFAF